MYDKLLEELTAMNGNAKSLLDKYDNSGVKLDEKTKELLETIQDAELNSLNKIKQFLDTKILNMELPTKIGNDTILVNGKILTVDNPIKGKDYYFSETEITTDRRIDTIGGFHYSLTPVNELLSKYVATSPTSKNQNDIDNIKGINKYSIWTLNELPENGIPEGKSKINGVFWRDIYPADEDYAIRGYASPYALDGSPAKIAAGSATNGRKIPKIPLSKGGNGIINYGKLTQFNATEIVASCGMELPSYAEFQESSYGVVEQKSANELGYVTNGIITHIPELTSKYGIEMATSTQWYWSKDLFNGYGNSDFAERIGLTDNRGYMYAPSNTPVSMLLGGQEQHASTDPCGSRALHLGNYVWSSVWNVGFFGVCRNMKQR